MTVVWTDGAREDLRSVLADLGAYLESHARRVGEEADKAAARLAAFPRSGRIVPEWESDELREVIVDRFRLVYRIVGDSVVFLTFHPAAIPLP